MKTERIDKYLADCAIGTRREVKQYIKKKKVSVNGTIISDPGFKIKEGDEVLYNGSPLKRETNRYYMLYKPTGVVSATEDKQDSTVLDLLKGENLKELFPVGRLDKDTEGLLIITDDGAMAHELLSPKKHVEKCYYVVADKQLDDEALAKFKDGVDIGDDKLCKPAKIVELSPEEAKIYSADDFPDNLDVNNSDVWYHYLLYITEGRYHQVKRMFQSFGSKVMYLKRISMGNLSLDMELKKGEYRRLSEEEISLLRSVKG